jgi:cytochrome c5
MKTFAVFLTALLCLGALVTIEVLRRDPEKTTWEFFPDMARSPASKAQSASAYLPGGQTDQEPVPGTISREAEPFHYTTSVHDFVRAGRELRSPFDEKNPADPIRGREIFRTFCQPCHGPSGEGDGTVVQRGFPRPPSLLFGKALNMKDGHLFHIVSVGFRNMPSYGAEIDPRDRWQVIAYVRQLQGKREGP